MKKAIIILSVLLAVLLIVAGVLYFSDSRERSEPPETAPTSETVETTQPFSEETTAATEAQPQIEVIENDAVSSVDYFKGFFASRGEPTAARGLV